MRSLSGLLTALLLCLPAAPAGAAWHKASSPHFIIYADQDPAGLKAFAARLERFDSAVRVARGMADPPVGDGNRLTLFMVRDITAVERLKRGAGSGSNAGFYMPRGSGSVAFVPRDTPRNYTLDPQLIFFHEYAHHLMFADLKTAVPTWLVEGFAEFYATADIASDGSVGLGAAATHRRHILKSRQAPLPIEALLGGGRLRTSFDKASLYARGWLLTHYLTFTPDRGGQLDAYLAEIANGRDQLGAAKAAFGDLGKLERDLDKYLAAEKFPYLTLPAARLKSAEISVEPLGTGAQAAMPLFMRLQARAEGDAARNAAEARALAAAHPNDPLVAMTLAEAEWVARDYAASEAAADKAMALMPQSSEAHIWKGRALLGRAQAGEPGAGFADARGWFSKANRLDPENPEPLHYFYLAYRMAGAAPTANAIEALHYAATLAPQDMGFRLQSAREHLAAGKPAEARRQLVPVAYNPHGGRAADTAREMIRLIDSREHLAAQRLAKDD